jgi:Tol biopolymer transport system component
MDSERWKRVERVYQSVLDAPPERRAALLEESCSDDPDLLREIESLLRARSQAGSFLSTNQLYGHIVELSSQPAALAAGSTVGPYEIFAELGAGSMGDVYRALDTRLDRQVALKILPARLIHDERRIARFRLEAKAASALNHPNIVTIYEIGQADGTWFIAEELVEGVTLRQRMANGRLAREEAIGIALQCALALEAAYRAGTVHRDIKPENIMMRPDGVAKVLDFGLARIGEIGQAPSPCATQTGSILGTPRYMSPEQARGQGVDARSDVFSLGAVLYEMLTGTPAFPGETTAEVFAALLGSEPAPLGVNSLDAILSKALAKNREARCPSMREFADDLRKHNPRNIKSLVTSQVYRVFRKPPKPHAISRVYPACALVLAFLAMAWYLRSQRRESTREPAARLVPLTTFAGTKDYATFSPDGKRIAFSWNGGREGARHIYVKPVENGDPVQLTDSSEDDSLPAWSPDGRSIAFCRRISRSKFAIYITPSSGGKERKVALGGPGVSWSPDGKWLALANLPQPAGSGGLFLLSLKAGRRRELTAPSHASDGYPVYSPNGRRIAFTRMRSDRDVFVVPARGGPIRQLTFDAKPKLGRVAWTADSRELVYSAQREYGGAGLWRVPLRGGPPRQIYSTLEFAGNPDISRKGDRLAYTKSWIDTNIYRSDGPGFFASGVPLHFGNARKVSGSSREDNSPSFSPTGERIAFVSNRTNYSEIWTSRLDGSRQMQLTHLGGFAGTPRWSPDGQWIVFDYILRGNKDIWVIGAAGGTPRRVTTSPASDTQPSWSPDGVWIYFNSDRSGRHQIWKIKPDGTAAAQLTYEGGREPHPSADGRTILYTRRPGGTPIWSIPSNGGPERPFPGTEAFNNIGRAWGIVRQGIYFVSWDDYSRSQRIRFFSFAAQRVTTLGDWDKRTSPTTPNLALSPDGRHLLTVHTDQRVNDLMMIENFR